MGATVPRLSGWVRDGIRLVLRSSCEPPQPLLESDFYLAVATFAGYGRALAARLSFPAGSDTWREVLDGAGSFAMNGRRLPLPAYDLAIIGSGPG